MTLGNIVAYTGFSNIEPLNTPENGPASRFAPYCSVYLPGASAPVWLTGRQRDLTRLGLQRRGAFEEEFVEAWAPAADALERR
jgi:hypothetical protein